jgi:hypothetical protein
MTDPTPPPNPDPAPDPDKAPEPAEPAGVRYPHITVQLIGTDGNAFAIIGRVAAALRRDAGSEAEKQFTAQAFGCGSYDELLGLVMATVDVT